MKHKFYLKIAFIIAITVMQNLKVSAQIYNYFAGITAGTGHTGFNCTGVGVFALESSNSGAANSAFGTFSLRSNTTGEFNTAIGQGSLYYNTTADDNTAIGSGSLYVNTSGSFNTATGSKSLYNNNGNSNSAFGYNSLFLNTTGTENAAFGSSALYSNVSGSNNSAYGDKSLHGNTAGFQNAAFGSSVLYSNIDGFYNTALGGTALYYNTNGNRNTAIGLSALYTNTTGVRNTATGLASLNLNTTGGYNTATGCLSLATASTANSNTAIGYSSLYYTTTGNNNTAMGDSSLMKNTTGSNNVAFGKNAGAIKQVYNKCTFIGATADATAGSFSNATAFGYGAKVDGSNKVRIGNTGVTSIAGQVGWTTSSDVRLKENINDSKLGLNFILNLRPVSYNFKTEDQKGMLYTGLIAQGVDAAAKKEGVDFSGVDKNGDYWGIRYGDLTVPLIKGMQEQQVVINAQKNEIRELKTEMYAIKTLLTESQLQKVSTFSSVENKLEQNNPNPFNQSTVIRYKLSGDSNGGNIIIRDLNGNMVKSIAIINPGKGQVTINGNELAQGTYTYSLEIAGESVDTKLMVITK